MATIKKAGFSEKCALLCVCIGRSYTRCLFREHSRQRQKGHHNNTNIWEECDDYQALASRLEKATQEIKALVAAGDVNLEPMEELRFVYLLIAINRIILYSPQPKFVSALSSQLSALSSQLSALSSHGYITFYSGQNGGH